MKPVASSAAAGGRSNPRPSRWTAAASRRISSRCSPSGRSVSSSWSTSRAHNPISPRARPRSRTPAVGGARTGGEGVAARTMSTLHAIFQRAVRLGKIGTNPAKGVRRLASTPRDRRLSRGELPQFGHALRAAEADGEHPTGIASIRFLLLTGFRRMEGLGLKREWLNADEHSIRLPDSKNGAQTRVIGRTAVDLLLAQPTATSPFFFPADWGEGHFIGIVRVLDRVCAKAKSCRRHTAHLAPYLRQRRRRSRLLGADDCCAPRPRRPRRDAALHPYR